MPLPVDTRVMLFGYLVLVLIQLDKYSSLSSMMLISVFGLGLALTSIPDIIAKNQKHRKREKQQSLMASMKCAINDDDMTSYMLFN